MAKHTKKKPVRGSGVSITLPTEPTAGDAKSAAVMAVMVQDDGVPILEYELKLGNAIEFRVGGATKAFMERVGPAPDSEIYIDTLGANAQPVTVEFEHALAGPQTKVLGPGQRLTINPVMARRWVMSAPTWE